MMQEVKDTNDRKMASFSKCFNNTSQSLKIRSVLALTVPNCQEMGLYFFSSFRGSYEKEGKGSVSLQIMVSIHQIHTVIADVKQENPRKCNNSDRNFKNSQKALGSLGL